MYLLILPRYVIRFERSLMIDKAMIDSTLQSISAPLREYEIAISLLRVLPPSASQREDAARAEGSRIGSV
jgi:hypothetical protein